MVFGSFSSLLSYRLPRDLPVGMTRSACPSCHHVLAARDLVPLLGYVFQHGHCRWCQKAISRRYPLMELTCALLFVVAFMAFGASLSGVLFAGLSFALLVVVVSDLETYIIPDTMVILVGVLGILWRWKVVPGFGDAFLGALLGGGLTLGLRALFLLLRRKQGLGLGDVKFIAVAGIWLGFEALPWLLVLGGSFGVVFGMAWQARNRLCRKKRTSRRKLPSYFPFGPALAFALYLLVLIQQRGYPWF
ncbi:MAG: hypothetical protein A2018_07785 [Alphaproteobacteria bacterium GWF2_58_20]|nr:MAG: hypothetical protein A2018_07785 [Alphaproteobacteria bacterium GWF2_58_20]